MIVTIFDNCILTFLTGEKEDRIKQPPTIRHRIYSDNKEVITILARTTYRQNVYDYTINFYSFTAKIWYGKYFCKYGDYQTIESSLYDINIVINDLNLKIQTNWLEDGELWKMNLTATKKSSIECEDSEQPFETIFEGLRNTHF